MPKPKPGEQRDLFIERCMDDAEARSTFPNADQRFAFCNAQWEQHVTSRGDSQNVISLRGTALRPLLAADGQVPDTIHLMPVGEWNGHPQGPIEITVGMLQQIVENFGRFPLDIPIDYEHATESFVSDPAPAAGWIKELELRPDGLWGHVEWTDRGREYIEKREYRYLSPAWATNAAHPETGAEIGPMLVSAALTNRPFFSELTPLAAKHGRTRTMLSQDALAALGLDEKATDEQISEALLTQHQEHTKAVEQVRQELEELKANQSDPGEENPQLPDDVREVFDLAEEATVDDLRAAKLTLAQGDPELQNRVAAIEARQQHEKIEALLDRYIQEGKLTKANVEDAYKLAASNIDLFRATFDNAPRLNINADLTGNDPATTADEKYVMTAADKQVAELLGISADDFATSAQELEARDHR